MDNIIKNCRRTEESGWPYVPAVLPAVICCTIWQRSSDPGSIHSCATEEGSHAMVPAA